jgi:acyl-[acyl-carrier-protein]-phospholipid O-acyltransferase/long-chain-fatty-acid--[acyl-carrier-protein] ligase
VDRYSRFAKLGGEMVSLTVVEDQVRTVMQQPDLEMVAVNLPDARKGEQIVLLVAGSAHQDSSAGGKIQSVNDPVHAD